MSSRFALVSAMLGCVVGVWRASGSVSVDGSISVASTGAATYLAVPLEIATGQAVSAVNWVNNDETGHVEVSIVPAGLDGNPHFGGDQALVEDPAWASLEWVTGELITAVTTSSGGAYVIFEFAYDNELAGTGFGSGAGIAYTQAPTSRASLISTNGSDWNGIWNQLDLQVTFEFVSDAGADVLGLVSKHQSDVDSGRESGSTPEERHTRLLDPAPNPFNPSTSVAFEVSEPGELELAVYNLKGQAVRILRRGAYPAGSYRVRWDGTDERGQRVASGTYLVRFLTGQGHAQSKRLTLVK